MLPAFTGRIDTPRARSCGWPTLVAPSKISVDGPAVQRRTASFATLHMVFVPEPGALLLLAAAGLACIRAVHPARGGP